LYVADNAAAAQQAVGDNRADGKDPFRKLEGMGEDKQGK